MLIPHPGTDQTKLVIFVCSLRPIFMSIVHGQRSRGRPPGIFLLGASAGRPCPRRPCRACSTTRADCAPLHAGAHCHSPDTLVAHCSYAANSYFHRISQADEDATCDFGGAAKLSEIDPSTYTPFFCRAAREPDRF
jgi:hypothetical protein